MSIRHQPPPRAPHALRAAALAAALVLAALVGSGTAGTGGSAALAQVEPCGVASLAADWPERDTLPQTTLAPSRWYQQAWNGGWGPRAASYPPVAVPAGCDPIAWQRARVVTVARRYLGLLYRHHHVPAWDPSAALVGTAAAGAGLDCSNFTAWVYNYGLGVRFTSNVQQQADGPLAPGRVLAPDEPFAPGDLLFVLRQDRAEISHVVIYVDENTVVDSHDAYRGITAHPRSGWYLSHYSHARRILEGGQAITPGWADEPAGSFPAG